jgi:hypothetical protein
MKTRKIAYLSLVLAFFAGCSVINAPDELLEIEGDGDGDGDGDMGGMPGDGDGDTGGITGDGDGDGDTGGTSGDGDGDGDTGGTSGDGDGDGDAPLPPEAPTTGLIVIAAEETASGERALIALDAANGNELNRESVPAVSVAYDEAMGRFAWYVFTSTRVDPGANTQASLEVRYYYDDTDEWAVLSTTSMLPPPLLRGNMGAGAPSIPTSALRPISLNRRLAYISQIVVDGTPTPAVTILNTANLSDVTVQESIPIPANEAVVGFVGRRGTDLDPEAVGGAVSVMVRRNCSGAADPQCELVARPIVIGSNISELTADVFGTFQGIPAFASTPVLPDSVSRPFKAAIDSLGGYALIFDPGANSPRWWNFNPADPAAKGTPSSLGASASTSFSGFAVSECLAAGITADGTTQDLTGVHLANGNVLNLAPQFGDTAGDIEVEPFRGNAITMRSPGSDWPAIRAFQIESIGAAGSEQIALAARAIWNAPADVNPLSMAVRRPPTPTCN